MSLTVGRVPWAAVVAGLLFLTLAAGAAFAPQWSPYGYDDQDLADRLKPPFWRGPASDFHLLGTDELGRDILTRLIYGARVSMVMGITGVAIGGLVGVALGLVAGISPGFLDETVMRVGDVQLAFPYLLLAIATIAVVGPSFPALVAVLSLRTWVVYARTVRAATRALLAREFTQAARALGARWSRLVFVHVVPNVAAPVIVLSSAELANLILLEATLSFLGLGVQPPLPSWGGMLSTGRVYMTNAWWVATFPGVALLLAVLSVNVLGDQLRDYWDPRLRTTGS